MISTQIKKKFMLRGLGFNLCIIFRFRFGLFVEMVIIWLTLELLYESSLDEGSAH